MTEDEAFRAAEDAYLRYTGVDRRLNGVFWPEVPRGCWRVEQNEAGAWIAAAFGTIHDDRPIFRARIKDGQLRRTTPQKSPRKRCQGCQQPRQGKPGGH